MAELVDALDLGSSGYAMGVQVPLRAPTCYFSPYLRAFLILIFNLRNIFLSEILIFLIIAISDIKPIFIRKKK